LSDALVSCKRPTIYATNSNPVNQSAAAFFDMPALFGLDGDKLDCGFSSNEEALAFLTNNPFSEPKPLHIPLSTQQSPSKVNQQIDIHIPLVHNDKRFTVVGYNRNKLVTLPYNIVAQSRIQNLEEKLFKCTQKDCGYTTAAKSRLNQHMKIHTGEKPFKCTHAGCNYATAYTSDLTKHIRTHTGESFINAIMLVAIKPLLKKDS
jgi:uncharacterized Zn-finger protein